MGRKLEVGADSFSSRFEEHWLSHNWSCSGDRLLVACSGGVDSLTLLHLLRFSTPGIAGHIEAAYFDHRLRPESADDGRWLRGVAGGWGVPLYLGRAEEVLANEAEAREARYRFLESFLKEGVRWVLTAHQEEDQVETILFRILRGSGLEGIRGIPVARDPGILRPLLPFSRREIEAYARSHHLCPRIDSTNRSLQHARNRIRHSLLPALVEVHPGAREGLLRLARHATSSTEAIHLLLRPLHDRLLVASHATSRVVDRTAFLSLEDPVAEAFLRSQLSSLGVLLSETGTAAALEFMRKGSSGKGIRLENSLYLWHDFGQLTLSRGDPGAEGRGEQWFLDPPPVSIPGPDNGEGRLRLLGRGFEVRWGDTSESEEEEGWSWLGLPKEKLHFPLEVRGWLPGDQMKTVGGTKKLKKVFGELQVPVRERARIPLLVDTRGEVLWIAGWQSARAIPPFPSNAPHWGVGIRPIEEG